MTWLQFIETLMFSYRGNMNIEYVPGDSLIFNNDNARLLTLKDDRGSKIIYRCPQGHELITTVGDLGRTLYNFPCIYQGCLAIMVANYNDTTRKSPTHKWVKPTKSDIDNAYGEVRRHYIEDGLTLRKL